MPTTTLANAAVQLLSTAPRAQDWPALQDRLRTFPKDTRGKHPCDYTLWACQTGGGSAENSIPGLAAIFACMESIRLVDDLLDEDPEGLQHQVGIGTTANLALALQAAAQHVITQASGIQAGREDILASLHSMMLDTAFGQNEELRAAGTEEEYWRVVGLKTPPLFVSALYIGCRLGGCSHAIAQQVSHLGTSLGILIQVSDDLHDVLQDQVTADWHHPTKNLALLFMQLAEYPEKEKFLHRLTHLQSAADLPYLQQQLISSGAISYGCYKLVELYRQGSERAASLPRPFVDPAQALLRSYVQQVGALLTRVGIPLPEDLQ